MGNLVELKDKVKMGMKVARKDRDKIVIAQVIRMGSSLAGGFKIQVVELESGAKYTYDEDVFYQLYQYKYQDNVDKIDSDVDTSLSSEEVLKKYNYKVVKVEPDYPINVGMYVARMIDGTAKVGKIKEIRNYMRDDGKIVVLDCDSHDVVTYEKFDFYKLYTHVPLRYDTQSERMNRAETNWYSRPLTDEALRHLRQRRYDSVGLEVLTLEQLEKITPYRHFEYISDLRNIKRGIVLSAVNELNITLYKVTEVAKIGDKLLHINTNDILTGSFKQFSLNEIRENLFYRAMTDTEIELYKMSKKSLNVDKETKNSGIRQPQLGSSNPAIVDSKLPAFLKTTTKLDIPYMCGELVNFIKSGKLNIPTFRTMMYRILYENRGFNYFRKEVFEACRYPEWSKLVTDEIIRHIVVITYSSLLCDLTKHARMDVIEHNSVVFLENGVRVKMSLAERINFFKTNSSKLYSMEELILSRCVDANYLTLDFYYKSPNNVQTKHEQPETTSLFNK